MPELKEIVEAIKLIEIICPSSGDIPFGDDEIKSLNKLYVLLHKYFCCEDVDSVEYIMGFCSLHCMYLLDYVKGEFDLETISAEAYKELACNELRKLSRTLTSVQVIEQLDNLVIG